MSEQMKPCPFCGVKVRSGQTLNNVISWVSHPRNECILSAKEFAFKGPEDLARAEWNTRSPAPASEAQQEKQDSVRVPREPTPGMLLAMMKKHKAYCEPFEPEYESGVAVSCGMTQEDCDSMNADIRQDYRELYAAMLAAAPSGDPTERSDSSAGQGSAPRFTEK